MRRIENLQKDNREDARNEKDPAVTTTLELDTLNRDLWWFSLAEHRQKKGGDEDYCGCEGCSGITRQDCTPTRKKQEWRGLAARCCTDRLRNKSRREEKGYEPSEMEGRSPVNETAAARRNSKQEGPELIAAFKLEEITAKPPSTFSYQSQLFDLLVELAMERIQTRSVIRRVLNNQTHTLIHWSTNIQPFYSTLSSFTTSSSIASRIANLFLAGMISSFYYASIKSSPFQSELNSLDSFTINSVTEIQCSPLPSYPATPRARPSQGKRMKLIAVIRLQIHLLRNYWFLGIPINCVSSHKYLSCYHGSYVHGLLMGRIIKGVDL
ncbi:hypothetical protein LXL04_015724 [Taraxacum kok-saghyz]